MLREAFFHRFFLEEFWVIWTFSFVFRVIFICFSLLFFLLFVLYLPFLQVADRSPVAIGIYPRGCVDRLLWFIISLDLVLLGTIFYGFCASPYSGITVAFLSFLAMNGDGRCTPCSLSMVDAPPRGLYRLYLIPQHNWLCWVKWQWLFCPIST